ncbi:MAG: hypothetical protein ACPIOQ_44610, partial [Promethearchaeia archaeon]
MSVGGRDLPASAYAAACASTKFPNTCFLSYACVCARTHAYMDMNRRRCVCVCVYLYIQKYK